MEMQKINPISSFNYVPFKYQNVFILVFFRVPTVCDFEPLNHHVAKLQQLVKAAQSVDEMSQTITDLLSEQRVMMPSHNALKTKCK